MKYIRQKRIKVYTQQAYYLRVKFTKTDEHERLTRTEAVLHFHISEIPKTTSTSFCFIEIHFVSLFALFVTRLRLVFPAGKDTLAERYRAPHHTCAHKFTCCTTTPVVALVEGGNRDF